MCKKRIFRGGRDKLERNARAAKKRKCSDRLYDYRKPMQLLSQALAKGLSEQWIKKPINKRRRLRLSRDS